LSRTASATDDLQLLNALRDQQQQQQYQQQLAAQASSASVLSMAASLAAGGAQQKPATLARAIAGLQSNPKDWKDRVDKISALAEVLNRQVRPTTVAVSLSFLFFIAKLARHSLCHLRAAALVCADRPPQTCTSSLLHNLVLTATFAAAAAATQGSCRRTC
jgi:hypothetical protein